MPFDNIQKYTGDPNLEAEHIRNNLLRSKINAARQKVNVLSGNADPGIQTLLKTPGPHTVGKYMASPASFEDLPGILSRESRMQTLKNSGPEELLNQGAFAEAKKRQSAWLVADSTVAPAPIQNQALVPGFLPKGEAQTPEQLAIRRAEQDRILQKTQASEKEASRIKRNKMMRLPLNTP